MTLTLLNIYNDVASQPWSAFDSDITTASDMEPALLSAINKALIDIWYSYPFSFRLKKLLIRTIPKISKYNLPDGNIPQVGFSSDNVYSVRLGNNYLNTITDEDELSSQQGKPTGFYIDDESIIFSDIPDDFYNIMVKYASISVGVNSNGDEIFSLENLTDYIDIPTKYEVVFRNALISKAMMYAIASVSDENYMGYQLQFNTAYKLLIKISSPLIKTKSIII